MCSCRRDPQPARDLPLLRAVPVHPPGRDLGRRRVMQLHGNDLGQRRGPRRAAPRTSTRSRPGRRRNHRPILLGEFGAYDKSGTPMESSRPPIPPRSRSEAERRLRLGLLAVRRRFHRVGHGQPALGRADPQGVAALDRIVPGFAGDGDPAQFGEGLDPGLAAEAAVARGAGSAERHLRLVGDGRAVDVADAGLDAPRDLQAARRVAGEHRRRRGRKRCRWRRGPLPPRRRRGRCRRPGRSSRRDRAASPA